MRIVLDTNCLIQSIPRKSPYRRVWDSIAKYIVTNDHHYDILRNTPFPHVDVLAIDEFVALIK